MATPTDARQAVAIILRPCSSKTHVTVRSWFSRWLRTWAPLLMLAASAHALAASSQPEGLSPAEWQDIRQQISAHRQAPLYRAEVLPEGLTARNPAHGVAIRYRADGTTVLAALAADGAAHEAAGYRIALKPVALGYGDRLQPLGSPAARQAEGAKVATRWHDGLREWWLNSPAGVEQWFEIAEPPPGRETGAPLTLHLALDTTLEASLQGRGDEKYLLLRRDNTRIRFEKLVARDADGRALRARMRLDGGRLAYVIDDRQASYPLTIDPTFVQQAYLKASNTGAGDNFGAAVAVSGDTLVVGAGGEESTATGVDGNQADNSAVSAGAAYVFVRDAAGAWSQQAYLKASNTGAGDSFGAAVAVSGDTVVVGAHFEDSAATGINGDETDDSAAGAGAAYVFVRDAAGTWSQQAYLKASNTGAGDEFGFAVAASGDTVVVGAKFEDSAVTNVNGNQADDSAVSAGAAYVFVRDAAGTWSQQAYLKASNTDAGDEFGFAVAVSGDTVVVGALGEDSASTSVNGTQIDNSASLAGAAYVFVRNAAGAWSQQEYLKASNTGAVDQFGFAVAVSGDTVVVGALGEDSAATGVFNGVNDDGIDAAMGVRMHAPATGVREVEGIAPPPPSALDSGAAYVFVRDAAGAWSQQAFLKASNTGSGDFFGKGVAASGNIVVVGAEREDSSATGVNGDETDNSAVSAGAAYVFVRDAAGAWSQQAYLKASNTGVDDRFGLAVAASGDIVVVGAPIEDSAATGVNGDGTDDSVSNAGAAYVFDLDFTIGGTASGLIGTGLVLQNNGSDDLPIAADGAFTFATALDDGDAYDVAILTQPGNPSQTCTVGNGAGTVNGSDIGNVTVNCADTFTIGGTVSGLSGATGLVLRNNGGDDLAIAADGGFTFAVPLPDGNAYSVTVLAQPSGRDCTVGNAAGTLAGADVGNVLVACVDTGGPGPSIPPPPPNNPPTGSVVVAGELREGATIAATDDLADADGLGSFTYVWFIGDAQVPGVSGSSLALDDLAVGKTVRVEIRYTDGRGFAERVGSAEFGPVKPTGTALDYRKRVFFFNPASNTIQESLLRLVNPNSAAVDVEIQPFDDTGLQGGTVTARLNPGEGRQIRSVSLEQGNSALGLTGAFGDGSGKWQLKVNSSQPIEVMSLVRVPGDQLSSASEIAPRFAAGEYRLLRVPAGSEGGGMALVRVVNRSSETAQVQIEAIDEAGHTLPDTLGFSLAGNASLILNTADYTQGNPDKGLVGAFGAGEGYWQLRIGGDRNLAVQGWLRDSAGILANVSGVAPRDSKDDDSDRLLYTVNPATVENRSVLRLVNLMPVDDIVVIGGIDDAGRRPAGPLYVQIPPFGAVELDGDDLESGNPGKGIGGTAGAFGDGEGRWQVIVSSEGHIEAQALSQTADDVRSSVNNAAPQASAFTADVWLFNPASNQSQRSLLRLVNKTEVAGTVLIEASDDAGQPAPGGPVLIDVPAHAAVELTAVDLESGNPDKGVMGALGDGTGKWRLHLSSDVFIAAQSLLQAGGGFETDVSGVVE